MTGVEPLAVAVWGRWPEGRGCIRLLRHDPRMRLAAVCVHSAGDEGRDSDTLRFIADDDCTSKATWSFLSILFALQSASAPGKALLLTLPIGK